MTTSSYFKNALLTTEKILRSESHSLKNLALISGYDILSFYRGAVLTGLDLSNQDLSGLNFEGADLTGSNLEGVLIDAGALNGSTLGPESGYLKDRYECYLNDLDNTLLFDRRLYGRCRRGFVARVISAVDLPKDEFIGTEGVALSGLSPRQARNIYNSNLVPIFYLALFRRLIMKLASKRGLEHRISGLQQWNQPSVEVVRRLKSRRSDHVSREQLYQILDAATDEQREQNLTAMKVGAGDALRTAYPIKRTGYDGFSDLFNALSKIN